jgi:glutaredoxin
LSCRAASSSSEDTSDPTVVVVAVVTTSSCPHCRRAKTAMTAAGIAFEEIDASAPDGIVLDAARQLSGMRTVPQVFVGGTCYGGADDVEVGIGNGDLAREVDDARREGGAVRG